jgi:hypothetical protein
VSDMKSNRRVAILALMWMLSIACGFKVFAEHSTAGGAVGPTQDARPKQSKIHFAPNSFNLVVFIHPKCPCTRATLEELTRLMSGREKSINAHVVVWQPDGVDPEWTNTDLCKTAKEVPGAEVIVDTSGLETLMFGAKTSGQAYLYDTTNKLLFSGGITPSRGHCGDNDGTDSIRALLTNAQPGNEEKSVTPVYGCSISCARSSR